jgi:hypothetical protein
MPPKWRNAESCTIWFGISLKLMLEVHLFELLKWDNRNRLNAKKCVNKARLHMVEFNKPTKIRKRILKKSLKPTWWRKQIFIFIWMSSMVLASMTILERFDGSNFHTWKVTMEMVLLDEIFGVW